MFGKKKEETQLDCRIEEIISAMAGMDEGSEEYDQAAKDLKILVEAKGELEGGQKLNPNTILSVLGNFGLGVAVILVEVFGHTITSKGWPGIGRNKA